MYSTRTNSTIISGSLSSYVQMYSCITNHNSYACNAPFDSHLRRVVRNVQIYPSDDDSAHPIAQLTEMNTIPNLSATVNLGRTFS